ncbi:MAG: response regulator [Oligoflexales bacterium]
MHILIVDEDTEQANFTEAKFSKAGFQVKLAGSLIDAEEEISKNTFSAILADYKTTQSSGGASLLQQVRLTDADTPCFAFMTSQADTSIDMMMDLGASAIYTKPFSQSRVINELQRLIKPRSTRWSHSKGTKGSRPTGIFEVRIESYEVAQKNGRLALGHGGVFIQLSGGDFPSEGDITRLALDFQSGALPRIEGVGIIRWVRRSHTQGLPPGCGIEFLEIPGRYRDKLNDTISELESVAFIPRRAN